MVKRFLFFAALAALAAPAYAATLEDEVRAVFDKYIAIQNAHDLKSMRSLLADSPDLLWISRGKPVWGREAALKSLEERYKGTWRIDVDKKELRVHQPDDGQETRRVADSQHPAHPCPASVSGSIRTGSKETARLARPQLP